MELYLVSPAPIALGNGTREPGMLLATVKGAKSRFGDLVEAASDYRVKSLEQLGDFQLSKGVIAYEVLTALKNGLVSPTEPVAESEGMDSNPIEEEPSGQLVAQDQSAGQANPGTGQPLNR